MVSLINRPLQKEEEEEEEEKVRNYSNREGELNEVGSFTL